MATQFSGGTYVNTTFTGAVKSDIQANLKTQLLVAGWTNVAQTAGQGPGNVGVVTISVASPGVVTWSGNHGLLGGERIVLQVSAGGALPTGLSVNTIYFVKYVNATTHRLATTLGGADINTSGSTSGTITLNTELMLLQSATQTNVTNPIRVKLKDNLGTCVQVSVQNQAGTVLGGNATNYGGNLWPVAAKTFRVIATKFHFICFTPGVSAAREFVMAGMLYVPSFLSPITDHGYMLSNSLSDSNAALQPSFRITPSLNRIPVTAEITGNSQFIWNSSLLENSGSNNENAQGTPTILIPNVPEAGGNFGKVVGARWANDDLNTSDVLFVCGSTLFADEGKIRGQFFDILYITTAFAIDSVDTFNGHDWWNLSNNNAGEPGYIVTGGIWVATS